MLHIRNGRVIDPACGIDCIGDVFIRNSRIVPRPDDALLAAGDVDEVDASGCLVVPGLIDFHTHLNYQNSDFGIAPDAMTFPYGVTSAVDPGSTGSSNFEGFFKHTVCASDMTIKSYVNVTAMGVSTRQYVENLAPESYDIPSLEYIFERYARDVLGLKVRIGKEHAGDLGLVPLSRTKEIARQMDTAICVHVVHPESPYDEILSFLGEGDVLCHCFQSKGPYSILDGNGKIQRSVREARARGVLFDAAFGKTLHNLNTIRVAVDEGFLPDVISTDLSCNSIYHAREPHSLLFVMSKSMAAGIPFMDVLKAVTATPARLMGMAGEIGTLMPGALAAWKTSTISWSLSSPLLSESVPSH